MVRFSRIKQSGDHDHPSQVYDIPDALVPRVTADASVFLNGDLNTSSVLLFTHLIPKTTALEVPSMPLPARTGR